MDSRIDWILNLGVRDVEPAAIESRSGRRRRVARHAGGRKAMVGLWEGQAVVGADTADTGKRKGA